MISTAVKPEFENFTDAEVEQALADPVSPSARLIVEELVRVLGLCSRNISMYAQVKGHIPEDLLNRVPPTAIERLAMSILKKSIAGKSAGQVSGHRGQDD